MEQNNQSTPTTTYIAYALCILGAVVALGSFMIEGARQGLFYAGVAIVLVGLAVGAFAKEKP